MFGGFTARPNFGSQLFPSRQLGQFGNFSNDADAYSFLNATGITDAIIRSAIINLVISLKNFDIWPKMYAIYPMVGGTSTTHKFNLKNPSDTDAAYRLSFVGGWTHSANGALPNGTNGYANTFLNTNTIVSNSAHLSYYTRTNSAFGNELPMGILNELNGGDGLNLAIRRSANQVSFRATENGGALGLVDSTSTDSRGLTTGSITASNSRKVYKNASLLNTTTTNVTWGRVAFPIYIGAAYQLVAGTPNFYTNKECSFASIGEGLTDINVSNLYTIIQTFQTALGRQV
jgi:hypothetical protein